MNVRKKYRRFVCTLLFFSVFALALCGMAVFRNMTLADRQVESSASVAERKKVYVGGTPIGIYLETDGVFVVDTGTITAEDGSTCCPAENIVQTGDYIQAVNGASVNTKEELIACILESDGEALVMDVDRQGEQICLKVIPVKDAEGAYKAGIWVRNDTQGIGTLTYVDEDGYFGALGHGISDVDTAELLNIQNGTLYDAEVISVVKGEAGLPGELSGIIHYSDSYQIGVIEENSENGIFGRMTGFSLAIEDQTLYETALKQEVELGAATILCTVDGTCQEYEVQIKEIRLNGNDINKGMVIEVTDPALLAKTGGIVQGMSGSPILQNGRLIGAVTHVFVNDPTKGYGIFIENMLEND
ncbi:MAG: SpoIVB peptidase [Clostridiales bacterium]|nr:SpoIVB peptidase [Clostridiales bacterium]